MSNKIFPKIFGGKVTKQLTSASMYSSEKVLKKGKLSHLLK